MSDDSVLERFGRAMAEKAREFRARIFGQCVTVYPSYGYREHGASGDWIVPMRVWVHDNRDLPFVERTMEQVAFRYFERDLERPLSDDEKARLESSLAAFIAEDKEAESIELTFDADPHGRRFEFAARTSENGVIEENIRLPDEFVSDLQSASGDDAWVKVHARSKDGNGAGEGRVRFLQPEGVSIVSDIDDTVKITQVPAGKRAILRNTFLSEGRAAEGMRVRYEQLVAQAGPNVDVCFHYVSGSPWQLYEPLSDFLIEREQFPPGTFHLKNLRKNLLEPGALQSIRAFILGGDLATLDQKVRQITSLMLHLPRRKFILIGDSGQKDPEVYRAIQRLFPDQIQRIIIRDVLGERLAGMELITGPDVAVALDTTELEKEMLALAVQARGEASNSEKL